jgi:predicted ATPase
MSVAYSPAAPVKIFISYAHEDEHWREKLLTFLAPLTFVSVISGWHDRLIPPGNEFDETIDEHLESAQIILLLVSADFLASPYCYGTEMKRAMQKHEAGEARVIPIILRQCYWEEAPFSKLQALPKDARPIKTWRDTDRAFKDVVIGIRVAINYLHEAAAPSKNGDRIREQEKVDLTLYTPFNNLPASPTPFIGRKTEIDELKKYLPDGACAIVLHGGGGTGKTRIALKLASDLVSEFENGVCYVPLVKVKHADLLPSAISEALQLKEVEESRVKDNLRQFLENKRMLLLLDTFEHIASKANIDYLAELCLACPQLKILLTSRRKIKLKIPGAYSFNVPLLELPKEEDYLPPERLSQFDAVKLFIQSARDIDPDFNITNDNAPAVAQICIRLEGLALAIELVAASINRFNRNPQEMLAALENQLLRSVDAAPAKSSEQVTMHASIRWSYQLLSPPEQKLLKRLSVFQGGFGVTAARAVCDADGDLDIDISDGLWSLVDNNLLRPDEMVKSGNRFKMLDVINEYGQELLEEDREIDRMRRLHAEYFLEHTEEAEKKITSEERNGWLERLETDHGNLRAALMWYGQPSGDIESGLRLAGSLFWFWNLQAHFSEGRGWLKRMLERNKSSSPRPALAKALYAAGGLAFLQGDDKGALPLINQSVMMWRGLGEKRGLAFALIIQGMLAINLNELQKALACEEEAVAIFTELKDRWGMALAYNDLGNVYRQAGQYPEALKFFKKSLKIWKDLKDTWGQPLTLSNLGFLDFLKGSYASARRQLEAALKIQQEVKDKWGLSETVKCLGDMAVRRRQYAEAKDLYHESLIWNRELGRKKLVVACLAGLAVVAGKMNQMERAAWLFNATDALTKNIGVHPKLFDHGMYHSTREELSAKARTKKLKSGHIKASRIGLEQAITYALGTEPAK